MALNKTWAHLYFMASHVHPPTSERSESFCFLRQVHPRLVTLQRCLWGDVGEAAGVQLCEDFPAKFQPVAVSYFEVCFSLVGQDFICSTAKWAAGQWWPAARAIHILTFEVDGIISA